MNLLVASPTELSTAATDTVLALLAFICLASSRFSNQRNFHHKLWQALFSCLGISSFLGAMAHGVKMDHGLNALLWQPLYFFLGLTLTLLAVIAIHDLRGEFVARRFMPWLLPLPVIVVVITWLGGGEFIWFVLFEALIMFFVLAVYAVLVFRRHLRGAGLVMVGVLISIMAAALQASGPFNFRLIWMFDHNGLFHLVQMGGLVCFYFGAKRMV